MKDFLKVSEIPNRLDNFVFTSEELEDQIRGYHKLKFYSPQKRVNGIENEEGWGKFMIGLWIFFDLYNRLPSQDEYYDFYMQNQKEKVGYIIGKLVKNKEVDNIEEGEKGLKVRILSLYPSLIRELIFSFRAREFFRPYGIETIYNLKLDIKFKIDTLLSCHDGRLFGIDCFLNSERGAKFKIIKLTERNKHVKFLNVEMISNPFYKDDKETRKDINGYYLYSDIYFDDIRRQMGFENIKETVLDVEPNWIVNW